MDIRDFAQLLQSHDWYYERTEDPSVYKRGAQERRAIFNAKAQLGAVAEQMYLKYAKKLDQGMAIPAKSGERHMPYVLCTSTNRIGQCVDRSPNGFLEVMFPDEYRAKFLRPQDVIMLD